MKSTFRYCHLCQAHCGVEISTDDNDNVIKVRGDKDDPLSKGFICPKATALKDLHEDEDRLRQPLRRKGNDWEEVSWEEAFEEAAAGIARVVKRDGHSALGLFAGQGAALMTGLHTGLNNFYGMFEAPPFFSPNSIDFLPQHIAGFNLYGGREPYPDLEKTDFFLIIGGNPAVSNSSGFSGPNMKQRIRDISRRGGKVVVIDPRRTETAKAADEHLFISPGTDSAFLLAMYHEILRMPVSFDPALKNLDVLRQHTAAFSPERVAPVTGIPADVIRRIASEYMNAPTACTFGRLGTCIQDFGGLTCWLLLMLSAVSNNLNRPGGNFFFQTALGSAFFELASNMIGLPGSRHSRVRGLPSMGNELPIVTMAEEILTPGPGQIRAFISIAGNPVLTAPNGRQVEEAFASLEYMVAMDIFVNETSRFANIILPNTSALAHDLFPTFSYNAPLRKVAQFGPAAVAKPDGELYDWEVLNGLGNALARHLGRDYQPQESAMATIDALLKKGPMGLSLDILREHPHGYDMGEQTPTPVDFENINVLKPGQGIDCGQATYMDEIQRLEKALFEQARATDSLKLISRRDLKSIGAWYHNADSMMKGRERCVLHMNAVDMEERGLCDGDEVSVTSRTGQLEVVVEGTRDMMPGVVSLPYGWGHKRGDFDSASDTRLSIATQRPGVSVNDLTDEQRVDEMTACAAASGTPVTVAKIAS
ncbi:MAG: molybdopterin-dependent oxidoreductase [Pseudomonadota bacterium]